MTRFLAFLVAGFLMLSAPAAFAQSNLDFTLVNQTGYVINEVYVSPSSAEDWQDDVLGVDQFPDDAAVDISFSRSSSECQWDLMVVYTDGETAAWGGIDLCSVSTVALFYNSASGETWAEVE